MKYLHLTAVLFLCLLLPSVAFAAPKSNLPSLKGFTISVPDTVYQGSDFTAVYVLEATHWKNARVTQGTGLTLNDYKSDVVKGRPYSGLVIKVKYSTSRVGRITLPPMTAEIDGKEVQSEPKEIYVKPHPQYGEEMTVAYEWLLKKGADKDSLSMNYKAQVGDFFFFCDQRHKCFCLVAKKDTWDYAGDPVWAYSLESSMNDESLKDFIPYFFIYYNEVIVSLRKTGKKAQTLVNDAEQVPPLLGRLRWGQAAPYNAKLPTKDGKRVLVGCVPLAVTMIMKYHEWPKQGVSNVYCETAGRKFSFDCTEMKPQWSQYKDQYGAEETEECTELSKVLGALALIMSPTYKDSGTSASLGHTKHIMCNNFGYSGRMSHYYEPSDKKAYSLLKQEVVNRRPCIVSRSEHAFVCDGYEDGFFHYNMGWKGHGNGYFRAVGSGEKDRFLFKGLVVGIEPQKSESSKEVTLQKAGTLNDLLTDNEKENLTSLTINGPINSSDIRLIRAMSGAKGDSQYDSRNMGTLRTLDLTNAVITKDDTPYRTLKATGGGGFVRMSMESGRMKQQDYSFNFNNMDEKKWKSFQSNYASVAKGMGISYTRKSDTEYFMSFICLKNTIGTQMFSECSSLREIDLPKNTKEISYSAFASCSSLQEIYIPESIKNFGRNVFQNCLSLETLYFPKSKINMIRSIGMHNVETNVSPGFKIEEY